MPDSTSSFTPMDRKVSRPVWKRRRTLLGAAAAVLVLAIGGFALTLPASGTVAVPESSVDISSVKRGPFQDFLALRGEVMPMDTYLITAQAAGRVESISASDGETLAAGAKLATLANADFRAGIAGRKAEASVQMTQANTLLINLTKSQADSQTMIDDTAYALHKAELEWEKREELYRDGIVNDAYIKPYADEVTYQRAKLAQLKANQAADAPTLASQKRQIQASAEELKRNVEQLNQGLDALIVLAPAAGRLSGFTLKPGQAVKEGDPLGEIDSGDSFKLKALVDEYFAARLRTGLKATAFINGKPYPLTLSKIYQQVAEGRVMVELQFADAAQGNVPVGLQPGQTMDVKLSLGGDTAEALLVPNGAWLRETGGTSIFVLTADGEHADRRDVRIGRRNPDSIEILGGLSAGERVLTATRLDHTDATHLTLTKGNRE
jgi:HlyD family secretion protein